jgi:hypothetical protein
MAGVRRTVKLPKLRAKAGKQDSSLVCIMDRSVNPMISFADRFLRRIS